MVKKQSNLKKSYHPGGKELPIKVRKSTQSFPQSFVVIKLSLFLKNLKWMKR